MRNNKKKLSSYGFGLAAELLAALLLILKGYRICAWRYKTPVGEIDLIARRGRVMAFVEVKARQTMEGALESVTATMQSRIIRAAQFYVTQNPACGDCDLRFDLVAFAPPFRLRHLSSAWQSS